MESLPVFTKTHHVLFYLNWFLPDKLSNSSLGGPLFHRCPMVRSHPILKFEISGICNEHSWRGRSSQTCVETQEWKPILGPEFVADRKSCGELQEIQVFGAGFLSGTDFCWAKWHRKWLSVWGKSIEESKNTVLKDVFFWWLVSTHDLIGSFSGLSLYLLLMYISTDLFYFMSSYIFVLYLLM